MTQPQKYTIITVESYPYGFETKYFYLKDGSNLMIGDVIRTKTFKQYKIIDGKNKVDFEDIDLNLYHPFE